MSRLTTFTASPDLIPSEGTRIWFIARKATGNLLIPTMEGPIFSSLGREPIPAGAAQLDTLKVLPAALNESDAQRLIASFRLDESEWTPRDAGPLDGPEAGAWAARAIAAGANGIYLVTGFETERKLIVTWVPFNCLE